MRIVPLILLGNGGVGRAFQQQIESYRQGHPNGMPIRVQMEAVVTSTTLKRTGLPDSAREPSDWSSISQLARDVSLRTGVAPVIVDATSADIDQAHLAWVREGFTVVTANKRPLTGDYEVFETLTGAFDRRGHRSYWFEATVGAGLPVVRTLRELIETGDGLISIRAAPSGTLNTIATCHEGGQTFTEALALAESRGLTEPDPRTDLSGRDVARKALILARLFGKEPVTKTVEPFISKRNLSEKDWRERAAAEYEARHQAASRRHRTPRYLLQVDNSGYRVGFSDEPPHGTFGRLRGDENAFVFASARYLENDFYGWRPMTVSGPGAGHDVTATALFGDVLRSIARL